MWSPPAATGRPPRRSWWSCTTRRRRGGTAPAAPARTAPAPPPPTPAGRAGDPGREGRGRPRRSPPKARSASALSPSAGRAIVARHLTGSAYVLREARTASSHNVGVEFSADLSPSTWIAPRLLSWGQEQGTRVASVVPTGYAAYVRVLHPASRREH